MFSDVKRSIEDKEFQLLKLRCYRMQLILSYAFKSLKFLPTLDENKEPIPSHKEFLDLLTKMLNQLKDQINLIQSKIISSEKEEGLFLFSPNEWKELQDENLAKIEALKAKESEIETSFKKNQKDHFNLIIEDIQKCFYSTQDLTEEDIRQDIIRKLLEASLREIKEKIFKDNAPDCFICYSVGDPVNDRWTYQLADDLEFAGIKIIFDKKEYSRDAIIPLGERGVSADFVIVIGTKSLMTKWRKYIATEHSAEPRSQGHYVYLELLGIIKRVVDKPSGDNGIINVLLEGDYDRSFPLALQGKVAEDFRNFVDYVNKILALIKRVVPEDKVQIFEKISSNYHREKQALFHMSKEELSKHPINTSTENILRLIANENDNELAGNANSAGGATQSVVLHAYANKEEEHGASAGSASVSPMEDEEKIYTSDFKKMVKSRLFVDKSLLIKDLIDNENSTNIILRPYGFGKTLNMRMLNYFFN